MTYVVVVQDNQPLIETNEDMLETDQSAGKCWFDELFIVNYMYTYVFSIFSWNQFHKNFIILVIGNQLNISEATNLWPEAMDYLVQEPQVVKTKAERKEFKGVICSKCNKSVDPNILNQHMEKYCEKSKYQVI